MNHHYLLSSFVIVLKIEPIVKGCLELRGAITDELQLILLFYLDPDIKHVPVKKKNL